MVEPRGARVRPPRVKITYPVITPDGLRRDVELPFVIGVLADLSGAAGEALPPVEERDFLEIDLDNFHERLRAIRPRVAYVVGNTLAGTGETLHVESEDRWSPWSTRRPA